MDLNHTFDSYLVRWAPVGGLLFVLLFVLGIGLANTPSSDAPAEEWAAFFTDAGNRTQIIGTAFAIVFAALGFLWFWWGQASVLRRHESGQDTARGFGQELPSLMLSLAVGATVLIMAAGLAIGATAGAISFGEAPPLSVSGGETAMLIEQVGFGLFLIGAMLLTSALVALWSAAAWQARLQPRWLSYLGFLTAALLVFAFIALPVLALLVWMLTASIYQLTRGRWADRAEGARPAAAGI